MPRPPIVFGLVVHQFVYPDTCGALFACGDMGKMELVSSTFVDVGRETVARNFVDSDYKYLLFVDSDMVFKRSDVERLIDGMEKNPDIGCLSAICTFRDGSYQPVAHWEENGNYVSGPERMRRSIRYMNDGVVEDVFVQGTGFMMIRKGVFGDLERPYFKAKYDENGNFWGEDISFITAVREAGWRTCVDFGVRVGHIGSVTYYPDVLLKLDPAEVGNAV